MSEKKTSIKTVAMLTGCIAAILALVAFLVSFGIGSKLGGLSCVPKLWFWSALVTGLYFCVLRPYFGKKSLALDKEDNLLYFIFGGFLLALLFHLSFVKGLVVLNPHKILMVLSMALMWLAAVACLKYVWADKKLEFKEYALAAIGVAALLYAVLGLIAYCKVKTGFFGGISSIYSSVKVLKFTYILISLALIAAACFLIQDNYDPEEIEAAKQAAVEAGEKAKVAAVAAGEKAKEKAAETKEKIAEKSADAKEKWAEKSADAKEKWADTKEKIADKVDDVKDKAAETKEKLADKIDEVKDKVEDKVEDAKEKRASKEAETVQEVINDAKEAVEEAEKEA